MGENFKHFYKDDIQMTNKCTNRCFMSLGKWKSNSNEILLCTHYDDYNLSQTVTNVDEDVEKK